MANILPLLHIHAQSFQHDDAYIVGNRMGLELLLVAVQQALAEGKAVKEPCVSDGEGYYVRVSLHDEDWDSPYWDKAAVPYRSISRERRKDAIWPYGEWLLEKGQKL